MLEAAQIIDFSRYPIADPDSADARALVAQCRRALAEDGAATLAGFVRPNVATALVAEARDLTARVYDMSHDHTVYFEPPEPGVPRGHPRGHLLPTTKGGVADDDIPATSPLRALYEWGGLTAFVAAAFGETQLHRHADPLAALNLNVLTAGQQLNWHFDRTDYSVTLSLQAAETGGDFEYIPGLRHGDDENYDGVARAIAGDPTGLRRMPFAAGTLALFRGHHALHRVTPVSGPRPRIAAVLSYVQEPGVMFTSYARELFYGRAEPRAH